MTLTVSTVPEAEVPLIDDFVLGAVDFKGRPAARSKTGIWKSASFITCAGVAERFAYYGISLNLVSYLSTELGQPTASAAAMLNAWFGTSSLLPILGAFLADSFVGRFRMIIISSILYISGLSCLALSTTITSLNSETLRIYFFFFSMYLVSIAQGGLTPCIQAFGADQFDDEVERESKAKSSFFNWWYCLSVGGILAPLLCITYVQENVSWFLGFGIPAVVLCAALAIFLLGTPSYRFRVTADQTNPFLRINRVFVKALRNWRAPNPAASLEQQGHQDSTPEASGFKFLEKALLASDGYLDEKLCSVSDVEDAKGLLRLAPIWVASLGYAIVYSQPSTLFTKQAATLDRHLTASIEIPAASLQQCFITAVIMIGLPLYDRVFVPIARSITKNPSGITMLQRISFGLFLSLISIIFAALVEQKRLATARAYGLDDTPAAYIPMSVWWLAPQYILSALADIFAMVGLQEFFYNQVPSDLKSIGLSLYLSILGIGSLLSSFLVSTIQEVTSKQGQYGWFADNLNRAHIDYFYWLLAGISAAGLAAFLFFNRSYVYRRRNTF